jgi:sugar phosphate permease
MLEVTLMDPFEIKELCLLMISFLIRETHNSFNSQSTKYDNTDIVHEVYFEVGAIVGLLMTGLIADFALKNKRFLMVFFMNCLLLLWDIYLFVLADT